MPIAIQYILWSLYILIWLLLLISVTIGMLCDGLSKAAVKIIRELKTLPMRSGD